MSDSLQDILCPECGYDLRAIDSDRCPECGHAVDRTALAKSRIPWTFRGGTIGRWRAYWRTVWLGAWRIGRLAEEVTRPVDPRDASRFATVTALAAALPFALLLLITIVTEGGSGFLNPLSGPQPGGSSGRAESLIPPAADLMVPYAAGMTRWPVLPAAMVLFAWLCTPAPRLWFRWGSRGVPPQRRERAEALSYYSAAPLVFVLVSFALFLSGILLMELGVGRSGGDEWLEIATIGGGTLLLFACFVLWWINALRLFKRTTGASAPRVVWTALALPLTWYACGLAAFAAFPWLAGYLWLMVESVAM